MKIRLLTVFACCLFALPLLASVGCKSQPDVEPTPRPLQPGDKGASTGTLVPGKSGASGTGAAPAGN